MAAASSAAFLAAASLAAASSAAFLAAAASSAAFLAAAASSAAFLAAAYAAVVLAVELVDGLSLPPLLPQAANTIAAMIVKLNFAKEFVFMVENPYTKKCKN